MCSGLTARAVEQQETLIASSLPTFSRYDFGTVQGNMIVVRSLTRKDRM